MPSAVARDYHSIPYFQRKVYLLICMTILCLLFTLTEAKAHQANLAKQKKLIIFDFDGVVVDSHAPEVTALAATLRRYGVAVDEKELAIETAGRTRADIRNITWERYNLKLSFDYELLVAYKFIQRLLFNARTIVPLIPQVLEALRMEGIDYCIGSNSPKMILNILLNRSGNTPYFPQEIIFSARQKEIRKSKPSPDIFLYTAKKMVYSPGSCIIIEDSFVGIKAAQTAKMPVIAYLAAKHTQSPAYMAAIHDLGNVPIATSQEELLALIHEML